MEVALLGHGSALYFEDGEVVRRFSSHREAFDALVEEIKSRWEPSLKGRVGDGLRPLSTRNYL